MFRILKYSVMFSLAFLSSAFSINVNFSYPTSTSLSSPDLGLRGEFTQIATDSSGRYVYIIWDDPTGAEKIQVAVSSDFGVTWSDQILIGSGIKAQITTDNSGKYVYAVWKNSSSDIQVGISSDFGINWAPPTSTPDGTPALGTGENAQITTDNSGKYVYAIWNVLAGAVQAAFSSDFGLNWVSPTSTPTGTTPNLASLGEFSQITTDNTGKYVYAIWDDPTGAGTIQVAVSSDFGMNWISPSSTPAGTPALGAGELSQITTNSSGQFVYAVWNVTAAGAVQVAVSSDFGMNWSNPTSTPTGAIPDLASSGLNAQITTDNSGRFIYALWSVPPGNVLAAISMDFGMNWVSPSSTSLATPIIGVGVVPQITTDISGRYIYAAWNNLATGRTQIVLSLDFGLNWSEPTSTPIG
ncbi:MAG: hypothetical protein K940chlam1_01020, partial [Candidatus Anoxychlamydiales bacterium]|nr:hypothetical protein [Candidatus Anoxychlamydiales bacterium]